MNSIQTLYKLMEVSSRDLEIPDAYQRRLNTERVAKIVTGFNERIANEPKVSFRDGHYYVFDGQHTIVARRHMNGNNDLPILCKVYYGMTEAEEALLFAMQTGCSAALTPSARLRANLRGEDKASGEFYAATEEAGLHVGFARRRHGSHPLHQYRLCGVQARRGGALQGSADHPAGSLGRRP